MCDLGLAETQSRSQGGGDHHVSDRAPLAVRTRAARAAKSGLGDVALENAVEKHFLEMGHPGVAAEVARVVIPAMGQ